MNGSLSNPLSGASAAKKAGSAKSVGSGAAPKAGIGSSSPAPAPKAASGPGSPPPKAGSGGIGGPPPPKAQSRAEPAAKPQVLAYQPPSRATSAAAVEPQGDQGAFTFSHIFTQENNERVKLDEFYKLSKDLLGEGSYGQVCQGIHKLTGTKRAIKAIEIGKISDKERFQEEMNVQQSLDHPHIVKLYEVFKDARKVYMVMELCTGGELFDRIIAEASKHDGKAFSERDAARIMQQIMGAVLYLHSRNYVHRDIKPENFLLQNTEKEAPIKVIDFGLAKRYEAGSSDLHTKAGTPYYVAPEVLLSSKAHGYNEKCDIWSLGVLAYILLCGYPPFYGDTDDKILRMVKKAKFDFPKNDWANVSREAKDFITQMLTFPADKRATAKQMMAHAWLNTANQDAHHAPSLNSVGNLKHFNAAGKFKKVCLTLIAKHVKEEEITELQNTFLALDANKDGMLTPKEIQDGMQKHKISIPEDLEETLKLIDTDGSGVIDYTEFIAATITQQHYSQESTLWNAFRVFDHDGSGEITHEELAFVLKDLTTEEVQKMILEADTDRSGTISFDEFKEMMWATPWQKTIQ